METVSKYSKYVPYLYFIAVIMLWFTNVNRSEGITAYPILLCAIPFAWQLIKPSKRLNFTLGITFVCLSSYLIVAYLSNLFDIVPISFMAFGGLFVIANFVMALWMIRNSLNRSF